MKIPSIKLYDPLIKKLKLVDEQDLDALLNELCSISTPTVLGFLNQHGYNLSQQNPPVRKAFLQMNYLLRDGIGIKIACKLNGRDPKANLNGSDLIPKLVDHLVEQGNANYQFFAMGTQQPWLDEGARALFKGKAFHSIDGFQRDEDYLQFLRDHRQCGTTPVIVLAMGNPRQEQVAARLRKELEGGPALMICGGAILDFSAQRFSRAPGMVRKLGLEWMYRLFMEPRRLFKRYVVGIPVFFYYVARNGLSSQVKVGEQSAYNRES